MAFVWNTNELVSNIISVYSTNLTLNKAACHHFDDVNYVMLGIDRDNGLIAIKPVEKKDLDHHIYPDDQLHKISIGKSYGRVTSKSFIETLTDLLELDFLNKNCYKFKGEYDVIHKMMVIDYKKGDSWL